MDSEARIREHAYLLWEQAGRPEGRAEEFWFAAVTSLAAPAPTAAPAPVPPARRRAAGPAKTAKTAKRTVPAATLGNATGEPPAMLPP